MIKVINNVVYDTEKSKKLASYHNGLVGSHSIEESIYVTQYENYFFYAFGGSLSKYRVLDKSLTGECTEGSIIVPLSKKLAMIRIKELNLKQKDSPEYFNVEKIQQGIKQKNSVIINFFKENHYNLKNISRTLTIYDATRFPYYRYRLDEYMPLNSSNIIHYLQNAYIEFVIVDTSNRNEGIKCYNAFGKLDKIFSIDKP